MIPPLKNIEKKKMKILKTQIPHLYKGGGEGRPTMLLIFIIYYFLPGDK